MPGHGTNAVRGEKFVLIQQITEDAFEALPGGDGNEAVAEAAFAMGDVAGQIDAILDKPARRLLKSGQLRDLAFLDHFDGDERKQADHRAGPKRDAVL